MIQFGPLRKQIIWQYRKLLRNLSVRIRFFSTAGVCVGGIEYAAYLTPYFFDIVGSELWSEETLDIRVGLFQVQILCKVLTI